MSGIYALARNTPSFRHSGRTSFTLIELLIVIAIVAILAVAVILVLNPAELLKESRDATRLSDMDALNHGILLYEEDVGDSLGTASTTYVSMPDPAATSTAGDQCEGLGLPTSTAFTWHCAASSTYENVDGTGWVPIDFTKISFKQPFGALPKDPTNTTSSGLYYTYTPGGGYELTAMMDSSRYLRTKASKDGGYDPARYETGSDIALTPNWEGLVGWWKFDDGGGATALDSSGNGNNATLEGSDPPTWTASGCMSRSCLSFDGTDDYVQIPYSTSLDFTASYTLSAWVDLSTLRTYELLFARGAGSSDDIEAYVQNANSFGLAHNRGNGGTLSYVQNWTNPPAGALTYLAITYSSRTWKLYEDGNLVDSAGGKIDPLNTSEKWLFGTSENSVFGSTKYFSGLIDNVRMYNQALSAAEIAAIYNAEK